MNRIPLTPVPQTAPAASWHGKDPPASNSGDRYGAYGHADAEGARRRRLEEDRVTGIRPGGPVTGPVNTTMKACFGTSAVYSCADRQCPLRARCTRAVSPWRF
jgi:hypothetical protein